MPIPRNLKTAGSPLLVLTKVLLFKKLETNFLKLKLRVNNY
jgi:hypothetical protein